MDASVYTLYSIYNNAQFAKWYWDFGDGQHSTERNPPHQYLNAGQYELKFAVSNFLGCTFDTLRKTIHLGSIPTVDFDVNGTACVNSPILFEDKSTSAVGEPTAFTWSFPGGLTSIEQNPTVLLSAGGSLNVDLKVRTYYGCEAEKTKTIEVDEKPVVDFTFSKDCDGNVSFVPTLL